LVLENCFSW